MQCPCKGDPVRISQRYLLLGKLEFWGFYTLEKVWLYVKTFQYKPECDRQTDGQNPVSVSRISIALVMFNPFSPTAG